MMYGHRVALKVHYPYLCYPLDRAIVVSACYAQRLLHVRVLSHYDGSYTIPVELWVRASDVEVIKP